MDSIHCTEVGTQRLIEGAVATSATASSTIL
jgi:hypothetical protein